MLILLLGGAWIAVALGFSGFLSLLGKLDFVQVLGLASRKCWSFATNFVLIAVPLYLFMGEILNQSGFIRKIYDDVSKAISGFPGGLIQTNIGTCTVFAACSGSSTAAAATIGRIGYQPILERGYDKRILLGSMAAGGTLGILIPPSTVFIIFGALTDASVGHLFLGGLFPGLLLASLFSIYIALRSRLQPYLFPPPIEKLTIIERLKALLGLWRVLVLALVILGSLYMGVATATEVAAVAASLALIFAATARALSLQVLKDSLLSAVRTTSTIFIIIIGALLFATSLNYYGISIWITEVLTNSASSPLGLFLLISVLYLIMGMFFDAISMMVITLPFLLPAILEAGFDITWFGVMFVVFVEIGLLTPPVGLNLYILQG